MKNGDNAAFPSDHTWTNEQSGETCREMYSGITKREYFAAKAMQTELLQTHMGESGGWCGEGGGTYHERDFVSYQTILECVAKIAYQMADAMIEEGEK